MAGGDLAFRAALKQRPDAYDYAWLADALDRLHQPEEAAAMRRDGLMLTLQNNPRSNSLLPGGASLTGPTAYTKSFGMHKNACPVKGRRQTGLYDNIKGASLNVVSRVFDEA